MNNSKNNKPVSNLLWIKQLKINDKLDVKRKSNKCWFIATVKNIEHDNECLKLNIHFDGFVALHDENIHIRINKRINKKLAILGTYTPYHRVNYTCNASPRHSNKCRTCKQMYCTTCKSIPNRCGSECEKCGSSKEYNTILNTLNDIYQKTMQQNIIQLIACYSVGLIAECSNFISCQNQVNFKNKWQFNCKVDGNYNNISYYFENDIKYKITNNMYISYQRIINKNIRLFCNNCTKNVINKCQYGDYGSYPSCIVRDVHVNKTIYYKNQKKLICNNHICCHLCTQTPFYKQLKECKKCCKYFCKYCVSKTKKICRQCIEHDDILNTLSGIYSNHIYGNIVEIIASYSVGLAIECSNFISCQNEINFKCKQQFRFSLDHNYNSISHYSSDFVNDPISDNNDKILYQNIYQKSRRIFCGDCTKYCIRKCQYQDCKRHDLKIHINKQVIRKSKSYMICNNHKCCQICKSQPLLDSEYYRCTHCNQKYCIKCKLINRKQFVCEKCGIQNEYNAIKNTLNDIYNNKLEQNIIDLIACYSLGLVTECSNFSSCKNEIVCANKWQFNNHLDAQFATIYYYSMDHIDNINKTNNINIFQSIYDKQMRIFCGHCTKHSITKCKRLYCEAQDICVNNVCNNHIFCYLCNDKSLAPNKLIECKYCRKYCCTKCNMDNICKTCLHKHSKQNIAAIVDKWCDFRLNIDIIRIITLYYYSKDFTIECCNLTSCKNKIHFNTIYDLVKNNIDSNGKKVYSYKAIGPARHNAVSVFGHHELLIVFCNKCVGYGIDKCKFRGGCKNSIIWYDKFNVCQIHPVCHQCNADNLNTEYYKQCTKCFNYSCYRCSIDKLFCSKCLINQNSKQHAEIAKQSTGYTVRCSNDRFKCKNLINIDNKYDFMFYSKDKHGQNIFHYPSKYGKNKIKMYGKQRRVFCSECSEKERIVVSKKNKKDKKKFENPYKSRYIDL